MAALVAGLTVAGLLSRLQGPEKKRIGLGTKLEPLLSVSRIAVLLALLSLSCTSTIEGKYEARPDGGARRDAAPSVDSSYSLTDPQAQELFDRINMERINNGLSALSLSEPLVCAADRHAYDVSVSMDCMSVGSDDSTPESRVADCSGGGFSFELIACSATSADAAVLYWLESQSNVLLDPDVNVIGVGEANDYWVAVLYQQP